MSDDSLMFKKLIDYCVLLYFEVESLNLEGECRLLKNGHNKEN